MTNRDFGLVPGFRSATLGGLVKGFVESGRYSVIPMEGEARLEGARALARSRGAAVLVYLKDARATVAMKEHHVHSYLDGSASGEAVLLDPRSGAILAVARERATASARARYATEPEIRDHLASRLARELARALLYERRNYLVDLEDPPDGALRRGIELAKRGEWGEARRAWEEALAGGLHPAAAHYDIAMAARVLGDPGAARAHLEAALALDPSRRRYRDALAEPARDGER